MTQEAQETLFTTNEESGFDTKPIAPNRSFKTEISVIITIALIIVSFVGYFLQGSNEPVKKSDIQILTESNMSFTQQIGILSEKKQDLVSKRNALDAQIKNVDGNLEGYYSKIEENTAKISQLRNPGTPSQSGSAAQ